MQEVDTLSKYGQSFQSKVISALITDSKFLDTIDSCFKPKKVCCEQFFETANNDNE